MPGAVRWGFLILQILFVMFFTLSDTRLKLVTLFKKRFYFFTWWGRAEGEGESESQGDSPLSAEPDARLDPTTLRT